LAERKKKDLSAEGAIRTVGGRTKATQKAIAKETKPGLTKAPTEPSVQVIERPKPKQKHKITAPKETTKKHFGKPFSEPEIKKKKRGE